MPELVNIYMYIYIFFFTIFIFSLPIKNMNDPRMVSVEHMDGHLFLHFLSQLTFKHQGGQFLWKDG